MSLRVLALVPALNVGRIVVPAVIDRIPRGEVDQILLVDDGSTDDTAQVATRAGAAVVSHPHNRGVGAAIRSGLHWAHEHGFDAVVILNAQGKYDPAGVGGLLQPLREGRADLVQGSRFVPGGSQHGMPLRRSLGTRGYSLLFSALLGRRVTDASSGIRAFRTELAFLPGIDLEQPWLDRYELEPYLLWRALELDLRVLEVPMDVRYPQDRADYTRMRPVRDWWRISRPLLILGAGRLRHKLLRPGGAGPVFG